MAGDIGNGMDQEFIPFSLVMRNSLAGEFVYLISEYELT